MIKRVFDATLALFGLVLLSPVMLIAGLSVMLDSCGPIFFKQERMGKGFKPFLIYKFRTMVQDAQRMGGPLTLGQDPRITRVGKVLRKSKIDELPQLINVLRGEMSFVGPRPEVRRYVEMFREDYHEILKLRPGITDLASLKYRDEVGVLMQGDNVEDTYVRRVLPDKIRLGKAYVSQTSLCFDLSLILRTLVSLFVYR